MPKSAPVFGICQVHPAKSPGSRRNKSKIGSQKQPIFQTNDWITPAQAARLRRVTRQAIAKLIRKGTFSTLEIGGRVFLRRHLGLLTLLATSLADVLHHFFKAAWFTVVEGGALTDMHVNAAARL